jgi:hypothetical protein
VLPLYRHFWPVAAPVHVRALEQGVELAEQTAAAGTERKALHAAVKAAIARVTTSASNFADPAYAARHAAPDGARDAADAAYAARDAVLATVLAVVNSGVHIAPGLDSNDGHATAAPYHTVQSLCQVATVGTLATLAAPATDFERLCWRAKVEKWTDDTPVPQSVFGPMWEGTPPPWWTDDVLAGLSSEPTANAENPGEEQPAPTDDAIAPH